MTRFILASQSPRRKELLTTLGLDFEVVTSTSDETYPLDLNKSEVPAFIAKDKALNVIAALSADPTYINDACIIAADTVVIFDDIIIGKPIDRQDAIHSLSKLAGNTHQVTTGVCIVYNDTTLVFSETTKVKFHALTQEQIEYYVDQYQPYDKAGGYAIQEWIGLVGIESIQGDFYNVMGLPVSKLVQKLRQLGLIS